MSSRSTVTILEEDFNELVTRSKLLGQLEAAGVDNWEGYPAIEYEGPCADPEGCGKFCEGECQD